MYPRKNPVSNVALISIVSSWLALLIGALSVIGWVNGQSFWPTTKANTGVAVILATFSFLSFVRGKNAIGTILAIIIFILGITTFSEYVFHWNAHIDELIFSDKIVDNNQHPGRMSILSTFAVMFFALSLVLYPYRIKWVVRLSEFFAVFVLTMSFAGFLAALFNAGPISVQNNISAFSLPGSSSGLLLAIAILFSKKEDSFATVFYQKTQASKTGIRGILIGAVLLVFLGWLCLKGGTAGIFRSEMVTVVMITAFVISFIFVIRLGIHQMNSAEDKLKDSERKLRQVLSSTGDIFYVINKNYRITLINSIGEKNLSLAWGKKVMLGSNILELLPKESDELVKESFEKVLAGEHIEYELHNVLIKELPEWVVVNYHPVKDDNGIITGAYVVTRDISGRRRAEEELRQSNNRFELISRTTNDAIWEWELKTGKLWSNETHQQLYGLGKNDPVPTEKMWLERIHPDDRQLMAKRQKDYLQSDKNVFISEYRFKTDNDEDFQVIYDRCYIVRDDKGEPIRMMGSMIDITERKQIENELRESEERYRILVENAPEALVVFDVEQGKFVSVSESAVKLFKMSKEELLKIGPGEVSPEYQPNDRLSSELVMKNVNAALAGEKVSFEWMHCDSEGKLIPCEVRLVHLPAEKHLLIRGSIIDISERKKAEEEKRKAKELSDTMIDSLPGIFYLYDSMGRFIRWNKQFELISEYDSNEIAGMVPIDFFAGEEKEYIQDRIDKVFSLGISDAEAHFITKSKKRVPFYFKAVRIIYEGEPCLLGYGIDISDRKLAEEELKRSYDQIRQLSDHLQNIREEERAHIAREIHDELGQQLTVLKMDASWLNKHLSSIDGTTRKKLDSLMELLNETVKTVRRISSELRPSLLDDMGLEAAMEWHLKEFEKRSSIVTQFIFPDQELHLSESIKTGLFRIFQESLTNVARHADAKVVKVSLKKEKKKIILSISDDGQGFEQEKTENRKTLGILGMKERTFMMGGNYQINSIPGKGTLVTVAVPYNEEQNV